MRLHGLVGFVLLASSTAVLAQAPAPAKAPAPATPAGPNAALPTVKDKVSYGIGRSIGTDLKKDGFDLDLKLLMQGIVDGMASKANLQTDEEFTAAIEAMQKMMAEKNVADGKAFLAKNAQTPGVKATASGLQYQVLKPGTGARPTAQNRVKAHYKGTFLDGRTFDSSYDRGEPAIFPLDGVIKGWTEGVPLMQVGAKYKFWIPSDLAYGPRGRPSIPPNSTLVFEIELLEVLPGENVNPAP